MKTILCLDCVRCAPNRRRFPYGRDGSVIVASMCLNPSPVHWLVGVFAINFNGFALALNWSASPIYSSSSSGGDRHRQHRVERISSIKRVALAQIPFHAQFTFVLFISLVFFSVSLQHRLVVYAALLGCSNKLHRNEPWSNIRNDLGENRFNRSLNVPPVCNCVLMQCSTSQLDIEYIGAGVECMSSV